MPNYHMPGSKTVHAIRNCHGLRAALHLDSLAETDEPANCFYCGEEVEKAKRLQKEAVPLQATPAPTPALRVPVQVAAKPLPPRWSAVLKQQAMNLLEQAILMEREGL
jgi:hypothetical protein